MGKKQDPKMNEQKIDVESAMNEIPTNGKMDNKDTVKSEKLRFKNADDLYDY